MADVTRRIQGPSWLIGDAELRVRLHAELGHFVLDAVPMDQIPPHAYWSLGRYRNTLCLAGDPLTITVVGQFCRSNIAFDHRGRPNFFVHVTLLRDVDREGRAQLMGRYSPNRAINLDRIVVTRWMSTNRTFPPVVDGTTTSSPSDMPTLSWVEETCPRRGDIVMLELMFQRMSPRRFSSGHLVVKRVTVLVRAP